MVFKAEEIIRLFIDAGIHLDVVNCEGATAAKICPLRELIGFEIFSNNKKLLILQNNWNLLLNVTNINILP